MEDLSLSIKDSFSIMSLLLVFAFVLFDIRYPEIVRELEKRIPDKSLKLEREQHRKKLWECFIYKNLLLIVLNAVLLYLFLPLLLRVLSNSVFRIWNFDFVRTAFVFVIVLIGMFLSWSILLAYFLLRRISESQ